MKKYMTWRSERPKFSFLLDRRALLMILFLVVLTAAGVVISTGIGQLQIHPFDVVRALFGAGSERDATVIFSLRLPRVLVALLVGAALAVSGAILQGVVRNPLASPDVIGITGGASVTAVGFLTLFETMSIHWLPFAAFVGALITAVLIYWLSWKKGVTPLRLVLVGIGIGSAMTALTTLILVLSPAYLTKKAFMWLTGSVYGTTWNDLFTLLPWLAIFLPLAMYFARSLNLQQIGDDIATGVGQPVQRHRLFLLLISVALAGSAVAIGGAVGFIGLLAPHIARRLVGPSYGVLIPAAALVGGLLVVLGDLAARTLFAPLDLPVGLFTAAVGAPFFIFLLYQKRER